MRVLLSIVGDRDPFALEEKTKQKTDGAILTIVKYKKPEFVYLFHTGLDKETYETKGILKRMGIDSKIIHTRIENPIDFSEILKKMKSDLLKINEKHEGDEIFVNISSGTPQMSTCWLFFVYFDFLKAKILHVKDPRFAIDKDRISEVDLGFMKEEVTVDFCLDFLKFHRFGSVSDRLGKLAQTTTSPKKEIIFTLFSNLAKAYALWDMLKYIEALENIEKIYSKFERYSKNMKEFERIVRILKVQENTLKRLINTKEENNILLLDFYFNSLRRFDEKNYADSLARFWRLYEGCLFYRLNTKHGTNPRNSKEWKSDFREYWKKKMCYIPPNLQVSSSLESLSFFGDEIAEELKKNKKLRKLQSHRNHSIVAHGFENVSEKTGKDCVRQGRWLLKLFFDLNEKEINSYAFSKENVIEVFEILKRVIS